MLFGDEEIAMLSKPAAEPLLTALSLTAVMASTAVADEASDRRTWLPVRHDGGLPKFGCDAPRE